MVTFLGVIIVIIVIIFPQTQGGRARLSAASFPVCSGLAYYCAAQQGLISQTDFTSITDRFGDIGARQGYNYYMRNPQRFTDLEIEATTNFIQSLINPKGEQSDDAE